jgi:3-keto-5-aminohexanoate cleavage enzyme
VPERLIINAALTGNVPTKAQNPYVPVPPEEIVEDCERCVAAGASVVHLHARDGDGKPTYRADVYAEILAGVRERCPDVIACVTTSGRVHREFEQRAEVLDLDGELKPDLASLTLGSMNFPTQASVNEPDTIARLAERMNERGIVPELEIFDFGMVDYAKFLIERGLLQPPYYFNLLLGSLGTLSATPFNLAGLVQSLPESAIWSAAGIGRFQFFVNTMAVTMGGHVRVGIEDSLYLDSEKQRLASNVALVERIAAVATAVERGVASPAQARETIGLARREQTIGSGT